MAATKEDSKTVPMTNEIGNDEDQEISSKIDTSIFDVFKEFELDLSCLSPPASPVPSTSELPPSTPSPPASPILARSTSFASQLTIMPKKSSRKASSAQMSSTVPAGSRGSWPLIKYAGRGTPIDRNRRLEWGGFVGEDVAEDGVLFTSVRSTSLDSGRGQSQRSLSPEWNYLSPLSLSSSTSQSTHSETMSRRTASIYEPPPEIAPLQIADKIDEWDSIMKTVLSPTLEAPELAESTDDLVPHQGASQDQDEPAATPISRGAASVDGANEDTMPSSPMMSPEQIEQLNNGLEIDLGINAALDLGLGQKGGMNWFDLGLLPASASLNGRETPSVYSSQAQTPQPSPPPSIRGGVSEHRSITSTKADANFVNNEVKSGSTTPWWRKIMGRFRRVHSLITVHRNRYG